MPDVFYFLPTGRVMPATPLGPSSVRAPSAAVRPARHSTGSSGLCTQTESEVAAAKLQKETRTSPRKKHAVLIKPSPLNYNRNNEQVRENAEEKRDRRLYQQRTR